MSSIDQLENQPIKANKQLKINRSLKLQDDTIIDLPTNLAINQLLNLYNSKEINKKFTSAILGRYNEQSRQRVDIANFDEVRNIINSGYNINQLNDSTETFINRLIVYHILIKNHDIKFLDSVDYLRTSLTTIMVILLEAGASVDQHEELKTTIDAFDFELTKILLLYGADSSYLDDLLQIDQKKLLTEEKYLKLGSVKFIKAYEKFQPKLIMAQDLSQRAEQRKANGDYQLAVDILRSNAGFYAKEDVLPMAVRVIDQIIDLQIKQLVELARQIDFDKSIRVLDELILEVEPIKLHYGKTTPNYVIKHQLLEEQFLEQLFEYQQSLALKAEYLTQAQAQAQQVLTKKISDKLAWEDTQALIKVNYQLEQFSRKITDLLLTHPFGSSQSNVTKTFLALSRLSEDSIIDNRLVIIELINQNSFEYQHLLRLKKLSNMDVELVNKETTDLNDVHLWVLGKPVHKITKTLLDKADYAGITPLHLAAFTGNKAKLEKLLKLGVQIELVDQYNFTALDLARINKQAAIIELLESVNSQPDQPESSDDNESQIEKKSQSNFHLALTNLLARNQQPFALDSKILRDAECNSHLLTKQHASLIAYQQALTSPKLITNRLNIPLRKLVEVAKAYLNLQQLKVSLAIDAQNKQSEPDKQYLLEVYEKFHHQTKSTLPICSNYEQLNNLLNKQVDNLHLGSLIELNKQIIANPAINEQDLIKLYDSIIELDQSFDHHPVMNNARILLNKQQIDRVFQSNLIKMQEESVIDQEQDDIEFNDQYSRSGLRRRFTNQGSASSIDEQQQPLIQPDQQPEAVVRSKRRIMPDVDLDYINKSSGNKFDNTIFAYLTNILVGTTIIAAKKRKDIQQLFEAIEQNNSFTVSKLIQAGVNLYQREAKFANNVLHLAINNATKQFSSKTSNKNPIHYKVDNIKQAHQQQNSLMILEALLQAGAGLLLTTKNKHKVTSLADNIAPQILELIDCYTTSPNRLYNLAAEAVDGISSQYQQLALEYFEHSLAMNKAIYASANHQTTSLLDKISKALDEKDLQVSLRYAQESLTIKQAQPKNYPQNEIADSLYQVGSRLTNMGRYQEALNYFNQSLAIAKQNYSQNEIADLLYQIGSRLNKLGQYQQALNYFNQSLAIDIPDGVLLNDTGLAYYGLAAYEQSLKYLQDALKIRQDFWQEDAFGVAECLENISLPLFALKRYQEAYDYLILAQEMRTRIDPACDSDQNLARAYFNKASYLKQDNQNQQQIDVFIDKANRAFKQALEHDELDLSDSIYTEYANFLIIQNRHDDALGYLIQAITKDKYNRYKEERLYYNQTELVTVDQNLQKIITNTGQIVVNAHLMAYYLLINNHEQFKISEQQKQQHLKKFNKEVTIVNHKINTLIDKQAQNNQQLSKTNEAKLTANEQQATNSANNQHQNSNKFKNQELVSSYSLDQNSIVDQNIKKINKSFNSSRAELDDEDLINSQLSDQQKQQINNQIINLEKAQALNYTLLGYAYLAMQQKQYAKKSFDQAIEHGYLYLKEEPEYLELLDTDQLLATSASSLVTDTTKTASWVAKEEAKRQLNSPQKQI